MHGIVVCRAWRSIALATPSTISIKIHKQPHQAFQYLPVVEAVQKVISRSGDHAMTGLSFQLAYSPTPSSLDANREVNRALKIPVEHAPRWREASFIIHEYLFQDLRPVKDCIPILENQITQCRAINLGNPLELIELMSNLLSLRLGKLYDIGTERALKLDNLR